MIRRKLRVVSITPQTTLDEFKKSNKCYIAVSLNNQFFTNKEKVELLFSFIFKHFKECKIVIADHLYRHNMEMLSEYSEEDKITASSNIGTELINFIEPLTRNYGNLFTIERWENLYKTNAFKNYEKVIMKYYNINDEFKSSILNTAKDFISRLSKSNKTLCVSQEKAIKLSTHFILEEIGVFCLLAKEGYLTDIYPGTYLPVLKDIILGRLPNAPEILKNRIIIEIKTVRKRKPAGNKGYT